MVINYTIKPILLGSLVARFLRVPSISFFAGISSVLSGMAGQSSVKSAACMMVLRKLLKVNERSVFLNEEDVGFVEKYNLYPLARTAGNQDTFSVTLCPAHIHGTGSPIHQLK